MKSQADEYEKKITETKEKALAQVSFMNSYWLINTVFGLVHLDNITRNRINECSKTNSSDEFETEQNE